MSNTQSAQPGDVYWIDTRSSSGPEINEQHRFVVISPKEINQLGIALAVPITTGGSFAQKMGLTVSVTGSKNTKGLAVCNQLRSFDLQVRIRQGQARYIDSLKPEMTSEVTRRVLSVIQPREA